MKPRYVWMPAVYALLTAFFFGIFVMVGFFGLHPILICGIGGFFGMLIGIFDAITLNLEDPKEKRRQLLVNFSVSLGVFTLGILGIAAQTIYDVYLGKYRKSTAGAGLVYMIAIYLIIYIFLVITRYGLLSLSFWMAKRKAHTL